MSKQTKEDLIRALDALDIQLNRLIKLSSLIPEPTGREDIDKLIDEIIALTNKLSKL